MTVVMMGPNASKTCDLSELREVLEIVGRGEGQTVVALVGLRNDSDVPTHILEGHLGLNGLMRIEVSLEFDVYVVSSVVDEDTATTVHLMILGLSPRGEESTLDAADEMINRDFLSRNQIVLLEVPVNGPIDMARFTW